MVSKHTIDKIHEILDGCIQCRKCMSECIMLNEYTKSPKMLFRQYEAQGPENMDRMIAYSCNECGQCTLKCPKHLNLKEVFQSLKSDYAEENEGVVPLEQLIPSEEGQVLECSRAYCTAITAGSSSISETSPGKKKYVFIPGSPVPDPYVPAVENAYRYLKETLGNDNVGFLTAQNDKDLERMDAETIITVCPSGILSDPSVHTGNYRILSYWDLMKKMIDVPKNARNIGKNASIFCTGFDQEGIPWVLDRMGYRWEKADTDKNEESDAFLVLDLLQKAEYAAN